MPDSPLEYFISVFRKSITQNETNEAVYQFLAEMILQDLKKSKIPKNNLNYLDTFPLVDYLRIQLENDANAESLLERLLRSKYSEENIAGMLLLKPFIVNDKRAYWAEYLEKYFDSAGKTFDAKLMCIYRLLDLQEFNQRHVEFLGYLTDNYEAFLRANARQVAVEPHSPELYADKIVRAVKERFEDPNFPTEKKWIYLLLFFEYGSKREINMYLEKLEKLNINQSVLNKMKEFYSKNYGE